MPPATLSRNTYQHRQPLSSQDGRPGHHAGKVEKERREPPRRDAATEVAKRLPHVAQGTHPHEEPEIRPRAREAQGTMSPAMTPRATRSEKEHRSVEPRSERHLAENSMAPKPIAETITNAAPASRCERSSCLSRAFDPAAAIFRDDSASTCTTPRSVAKPTPYYHPRRSPVPTFQKCALAFRGRGQRDGRRLCP